MVGPMHKDPTVMQSAKLVFRTLSLLGVVGMPQFVLAQAPPEQLTQPSPLSTVPATGCQETPESAKLYDLGFELLSRDLNREALGSFQRSYDQSHCPRALAQIASAERGLKRWADAFTHLRSALESTDPWIEENRSVFEPELAKINERLRQAGGRNEDPELVEKPAPKMPMRTRAGWGLLVSGVLVGGFASGLLVLREAFRDPFNEATTDTQWKMAPSWTQQPWEDALSRGDQARTAGIALAAVGGAAAVAGIVLIAWPQEKSTAKQAQLWISPTGNGLVIAGRF